jgi:predicted membrane protein
MVTPSQESVDAASLKALASVMAIVIAGIVFVSIFGYMVVTMIRVMKRRGV